MVPGNRKPVVALLLASLASLASACGTDDIVELGCIEYADEGPVEIAAPASALVGQPFAMTVRTYGLACVSFEGTDVELTKNEADVYPFDRRRVPGEDGGCVLLVTYFAHEATLTFDSPGTKTIRVHGRRVDCWHPPCPVDEEITVPITVVVE